MLITSSKIAGPFGLEVALSLARQGVSFRIIGALCVIYLLDEG